MQRILGLTLLAIWIPLYFWVMFKVNREATEYDRKREQSLGPAREGRRRA